MIENWKRGALVGVASAAIVTLGGGAAMAAGSHGPARTAAKATAHAPECGVVSVVPAKPAGPVKTVTLPSPGTAHVEQVMPLRAIALAKLTKAGLPRVMGCGAVPKGVTCVAVRATAVPGTPPAKAFKAPRALPALPGHKAVIKVVGLGALTTMRAPGCAALKIATCKSTGGKVVFQAVAPGPGESVTVRCGVAAQPKR